MIIPPHGLVLSLRFLDLLISIWLNLLAVMLIFYYVIIGSISALNIWLLSIILCCVNTELASLPWLSLLWWHLSLGRALGNDSSSVTAWACGNNESWGYLKRGFKAVSGEYALLGEKASSQSIRVEDGVVEILNTFLDLLMSYRVCALFYSMVVSNEVWLFRNLRSLGFMWTSWKRSAQRSPKSNSKDGTIQKEEDVSHCAGPLWGQLPFLSIVWGRPQCSKNMTDGQWIIHLLPLLSVFPINWIFMRCDEWNILYLLWYVCIYLQANAVEQLEYRILKVSHIVLIILWWYEVRRMPPWKAFVFQQENEISNMENRNYFSLHCVQMETQLIHANLDGLYCALRNLAFEETQGYSQV